MAFISTANARERDFTVQRGEVEDMAASAASGAENASSVTLTADGLTTGLIDATARFVTLTSANSAHIATLPVGVVGHTIRGWMGATGGKLQTPAASNVKINGLDSDGTKAAALPATTMFAATYVSATDGWVLRAWDELGAVITAIIPA